MKSALNEFYFMIFTRNTEKDTNIFLNFLENEDNLLLGKLLSGVLYFHDMECKTNFSVYKTVT